MKKELVNHFTWLTNKLSEINTYKNWSEDFKIKEVEETFAKFYKSIEDNKLIDLTTITKQEAKELRFMRWDDDQPNLWLFPLWIVPLIPEGMTVYDLDGQAKKYEKDKFDNDIRFGCVAYGIMIY